ncbi:MAG: phosphoglucosamine mutase [Clostridia bacterium]|nr:phosphoglucosamine mutase [Clostridia bacterium]
MGRLFGTDGIRGIANVELTCELAMQIGRAVAMVLTDDKCKRPKVLIGTDTRISSQMLQSAISAGLCSVGADVLLLGVLPTPAVALLVKQYGYDAGVMVSASHNPCEYNGIKVFQSDGYKLPDELEDKIESIILDGTIVSDIKIGGEVGRIRSSDTPKFDYVEHLLTTVDEDFSGIKIALDCANGSASYTAPELFTELGADFEVLSSVPNGININRNCGSTCVESLQKFVKDKNCVVGFAFDGDADRLIAVDENGDTVDGDKIVAICAKHFKQQGKLAENTAVVTVMSNMGFHDYCRNNGIVVETTAVGDRYVLERMLEGGFSIGGEQSGHVIFLDYATTGDGQLTAIQLLRVIKQSGKKLSELAAEIDVYPQVMHNVRVSNIGKARYRNDEEIKRAIASAEAELNGKGRVLVRVSGTEPLIRVMVEGKDEAVINRIAQELALVIKERLI